MQTLKKAPEFLFGGGEMGELIRNFDWSKTPLEPPEHWVQSLKTYGRIMQFPATALHSMCANTVMRRLINL